MELTIFDAVTGRSRTLARHVEAVREARAYARRCTRMEPHYRRLLAVLRTEADRHDDGAVKDLLNDTATCLETEAA